MLAGFAVVAVSAPQPALREGVRLDETTWEHAVDLLPDEILAHYRRGEYANTIADIALGGYVDLGFPPPLREANERNRGRFDVTDRGGYAMYIAMQTRMYWSLVAQSCGDKCGRSSHCSPL